MLKSLLVGTNGSPWSQMAVDLGLEWARSVGATVTYLGIVDVPAITGGEPVPLGGAGWKEERDEQLVLEARARIEEALERAAARGADAGVLSRTRFVEGDSVAELAHEIQRHDLLILGKRAVPHSDHDPAPSDTLSDILHRAPRPVVVAGDGHVTEGAPVLVAYDGSRQAARAVASFVASGLYEERPVHVLGVGDAEEMEDRVRKAVDFLMAHGRTAHAHVMPEGEGTAETILEQIGRLPAGMLVMGVYGQRKIREMFGSVTRSVLGRAPVPLFLDH